VPGKYSYFGSKNHGTKEFNKNQAQDFEASILTASTVSINSPQLLVVSVLLDRLKLNT